MQDESELLGRFARERDEAAFAEVVRRNIDCVYRTALRHVNADAHLAQDVAQAVFLTLAKRAGETASHRNLSGWLHLTTRFCASSAVRSERRWQKREQEAHVMTDESTPRTPSAATWAELSPILDEVLQELKAADREALLMRYYESRPFAELGARLGLPENTARMRVERALDKLRVRLGRRGITSTASALGAVLGSQPLAGAPADLTAVVVESAMEGTTALGIGTAAAVTTTFMSTTKNVSIGVGLLALLAIGYFAGMRRPPSAEKIDVEADLRGQVAQLRQENRRLASELQRLSSGAATPVAIVPAQPEPSAPLATVPYNPGPPARLVGNAFTMPQVIVGNLRQIRTAANRFRQEKGRAPASIDELLGPNGYLAEFSAVDGESYANLDLSPNGTLSVTMANGVTVTLPNAAGRGSPPKTVYEEAVERARAAFSAAHGRSAVGFEAADYFEDASFRETFLDQTRGQAFARELDAGFAPVLQKASQAYHAAYRAAHGTAPPGTFQSFWSLAAFVENDADRARFVAMLRKATGSEVR